MFAQGIGQWGNWFNNELYGGPTALPWRLQIHQMRPGTGVAALDPATGHAVVLGYFQPAFLYESLWDVALGLTLIWIGRRFQLKIGQTFALYVMGYTAGRVWIEALRQDHANHLLGLRLNVWTSIVVLVSAGGCYLWLTRHGENQATAAQAED